MKASAFILACGGFTGTSSRCSTPDSTAPRRSAASSGRRLSAVRYAELGLSKGCCRQDPGSRRPLHPLERGDALLVGFYRRLVVLLEEHALRGQLVYHLLGCVDAPAGQGWRQLPGGR